MLPKIAAKTYNMSAHVCSVGESAHEQTRARATPTWEIFGSVRNVRKPGTLTTTGK